MAAGWQPPTDTHRTVSFEPIKHIRSLLLLSFLAVTLAFTFAIMLSRSPFLWPLRPITTMVLLFVAVPFVRAIQQRRERPTWTPRLLRKKRLLRDAANSKFCLSQIGEDLSSGQQHSDYFGEEVSISQNGTVVAIGGFGVSGAMGARTGLVQVYAQIDNDQWMQRGSNIEGENAFDELLANALSNNGNILAVGAHKNDDNGDRSGHVRVYEFNDAINNWQQMGKTIVGLNANDWFGYSVALSGEGNILAVGAYHFASFAGQVRVFTWNSSAADWRALGDPLEGTNGYGNFGGFVSLSNNGTILAVGSWNYGGVHIFELSNNIDDKWNRLGSVLLQDVTSSSDVALSSDGYTLAMGLRNVNADRGQVQVFRWKATEGTWVLYGSVLDGNASGDRFGNSVSLLGDASLLAVGAPRNDNRKGQLQMFQWDGNDWEPFGRNIIGRQTGDDLGVAVAVSQDGSTVVVGASASYGTSGRPGYIQAFHVDVSCRTTADTTVAPAATPNTSLTSSPTVMTPADSNSFTSSSVHSGRVTVAVSTLLIILIDTLI